jgi:hypothetical protein
MTTLKFLTQSAMLGSGSGFSPPTLERVRLPDSDPEAALLVSAAVVGIGQLGGWMPFQATGGETPCPPETRQPMPERAAELLKRILGGEFEAVLPEFLQLSGRRGLVVPPETLPALLGLGKKELRLPVLAVIGERGRWLAGFNPAWAHALAPVGEQAWEIGKFEERVTLLEQLRATAPERARQLVQATWEQDSPEARVAFVTTFAAGLSTQDEPFLESCLDDRRREVRSAAFDLLARLPQSRLAERAFARLEPLLKLKSKFLGRDVLEVTLPAQLDPAAKRDGAGGAVLHKTMGEKANWLAQMLSVVPPSLWSREWNLPPEKLLQVALGSEWKEPLLLGWRLAAQRCGDPDWAMALAELTVKQAAARKVLAGAGWEGLIGLVAMEKLEVLAKNSITPHVNELNDVNPFLILLEAYPHPWSPGLARTVMASVRRQTGGFRERLMRALPRFGLRIPPDLAEEFATGWSESSRAWGTWVDQFIAVMRFRKEMMEVL